MRVALESAALAVWQELACQIHNQSPHHQIQICRSLTPLKSPPSAPAHSARPTQNDHGPGFCDFQKTLATAEPAAKNLCPTDLVANSHQKCKLQVAILLGFLLQLQFHTFFQKCAPRLRWEAHFRRTVFATIVCKRLFPYPNWLQNHHLWEGISALCCANYNMFCRVSGT